MRAILVACMLLATAAQGRVLFDDQPTRDRISQRLEQGDRRTLAAEALDEAFRLAATLLKRQGQATEAYRLQDEWTQYYRGVTLGLAMDTGDHAPISEWLADWYMKLEDALGVRVMELTHLRDIWVLNYTMPVVFDCAASAVWCAENTAKNPADTCKAEYRRHFAGTKFAEADPYATDVLHHGFSGVVTYWVVYGACEAATWGSGTVWACGPVGDLAEWAIEKFVAPGASDRLWDRKNPH